MASNLSTIGFVFANNDGFSSKMIELAGSLETVIQCDAGQYAVWSEPSGAQLWFHISQDSNDKDDERTIHGLTPFFEGKSRVDVKITKAIHRSDDNDFEGGFYAWIAPDDTGEGAYPMVFDAVDFALHNNRKMPFNAQIRLSAFARELTAYGSKDDYETSESDQPKLASQAFIPMGIFASSSVANGADNDNANPADAADIEDDNPSSTALLTGIVTTHHILKNQETGRDFHWLVVDSLYASFDVIADPDVIKGVIAVGGVVEVACWCFGRILDKA